MYKSGDASRAALPIIIKGLKDKGYRMVTVSELLTAQ
jgi:peptidoglycan/xylan/chitin deacetylase (PgdA/CDA1 family)